MSLLRTRLPWLERSGRNKTKHCERAGCSHATREGKPFCSDHVEDHPYVQGLLARLAAREAEEERVRKSGPRAVDPDGITAQEIVQFLRVHGPRTVKRLCRELNLDSKTVTGYVRALERRDLVNFSNTRRGATVVNPGPKPEGGRKKAEAAKGTRAA